MKKTIKRSEAIKIVLDKVHTLTDEELGVLAFMADKKSSEILEVEPDEVPPVTQLGFSVLKIDYGLLMLPLERKEKVDRAILGVQVDKEAVIIHVLYMYFIFSRHSNTKKIHAYKGR